MVDRFSIMTLWVYSVKKRLTKIHCIGVDLTTGKSITCICMCAFVCVCVCTCVCVCVCVCV